MSTAISNTSTLVLDVGKTHVKLLVFSKTGAVRAVAKLDNLGLTGPPYPHLDTERIWKWMMASTTELAKQHQIDVIVPTTHGCAAALVDRDTLVLPVLDYEAPIPQKTLQEFEAVRPARSPRLAATHTYGNPSHGNSPSWSSNNDGTRCCRRYVRPLNRWVQSGCRSPRKRGYLTTAKS